MLYTEQSCAQKLIATCAHVCTRMWATCFSCVKLAVSRFHVCCVYVYVYCKRVRCEWEQEKNVYFWMEVQRLNYCTHTQKIVFVRSIRIELMFTKFLTKIVCIYPPSSDCVINFGNYSIIHTFIQ